MTDLLRLKGLRGRETDIAEGFRQGRDATGHSFEAKPAGEN